MAATWLKILTESRSVDIDGIAGIIQEMIKDMPEHIAYELMQRYTLYEYNRAQLAIMKNNGQKVKEEMQYYLRSSDPAPLFAPFLHWEHRFDITRHYLKHYWRIIEQYALYRQDKLQVALSSKSPRIREILKTREGFGFIDYAAKSMYNTIYDFNFNSPRFHGKMKDGRASITNYRKATRFPRIDEVAETDGGWVIHGQTDPNSLVSFTYYCSKCKKQWRTKEEMEADTVLIRLPYKEDAPPTKEE